MPEYIFSRLSLASKVNRGLKPEKSIKIVKVSLKRDTAVAERRTG